MTRSEEINARNRERDPSKPYVQEGDTGGFLEGVGVTIGEGSSLTQAQADDYYRQGVSKYGQATVDDYLSRNRGDYHRIDSGLSSEQTGSGPDQQGGSSDGRVGTSQPSPVQDWTRAAQSAGWAPASVSTADTNGSALLASLLQRQIDEAAASRAAAKQRGDSLFEMLMAGATRAATVDRTDPNIRSRADAYSAQETRAQRDYLSDLAESSGPYASLRGERRVAAERLGQRTGEFEAQLLSQELTARRQEIAQKLSGALGIVSADQARALQEQLASIDTIIAQQGLAQSQQGLDQNLRSILMNNDLGLRQLGLNEWDKNEYWNAQRLGLL